MTLTQRLAAKSKGLTRSPLQLRPSVSPESVIAMLPEIAKEIVNARMIILERAIRAEAEQVISDIRAIVPILERESSEAILEHIRSRAVEIRGEPGYTPIKGVDYFDGKTPTKDELTSLIKPMIPAPVKGDKGDDGSPDSPEEIVGKINKSERLIDFKMISGLNEWVNKVQQIVREKKGGGSGGGGGMGAFQSELKNVSSATTTISTTYAIAGNGQVLWLSYNGQALHRGTDYTVGSDRKTITLLFTPTDSTVIQVDYIRG